MPIRRFASYNAYSEAYEVLRTVDLVGRDNSRCRIEVLRDHSNPASPFTVRYYGEESVVCAGAAGAT
ncbi:MAG: hypothetical protein R3B70_44460 [Polyangiaceae bacterium]